MKYRYRDITYRLKRYKLYWKQRLYYILVDLIKERASERLLDELTKQMFFEWIVIPKLKSLGFTDEELRRMFPSYLGYAKKLWNKKYKYVFSSLDVEHDNVYYEMIQRGFDKEKSKTALNIGRKHPVVAKAYIKVSSTPLIYPPLLKALPVSTKFSYEIVPPILVSKELKTKFSYKLTPPLTVEKEINVSFNYSLVPPLEVEKEINVSFNYSLVPPIKISKEVNVSFNYELVPPLKVIKEIEIIFNYEITS